MDSIEALRRVVYSLSKGVEVLYFSESVITGECAQQVKDIIRLRKSGNVTEETLDNVLSCMKSGNGLGTLGLICSGLGYWKLSVKSYEKSILVFEKKGEIHGAAQTYNNLGLVYFNMGGWKKAIEYYQKSREIFEKIRDIHGASQTYMNLGSAYLNMGRWEKAIEYYQKSLETKEKIGDLQGLAKTYMNLGSVYLNMGEWENAIEYYQKSLEKYEKIGDVQGVAQTCGNLGSVYSNMGEREKAIEYNLISLKTFEEIGDVQGAAKAYNNLGLEYNYMGDGEKAIEYYLKSLEKYEKIGDVYGTGQAYGNLGLVYSNMEEWEKAIEYYLKDLEISEIIGDVHGKGITLSNLGKLCLEKKPPEPEKALQYLEDSIRFLNKESRPYYPNALNWLASCYHKIGTIKKSEAKRENDRNKKEKLVDSVSSLFLDASRYYDEVEGLPRVNIPSLKMYAHLDKGLSYSVKNINEKDDKKALGLLDNALREFNQALVFADASERSRLEGIIKDHEAKRYIRLVVTEESPDEQDRLLEKAISALESSADHFKNAGDEEQCHVKTCQGCMHLYKGLKSFREGIKEYNHSKINKQLSESIFELEEARKCYEDAVSELGKDTMEILNRSFVLVEELLKRRDEELVTNVTKEFIIIMDELSSVGLQKMVKIYTFDEKMKGRVEKEDRRGDVQISVSGKMEGDIILTQSGGEAHIEKTMPEDKKMSIPDAATLSGFFGWIGGSALMFYGYTQNSNISVVIGIVLFLFLLIMRLRHKK